MPLLISVKSVQMRVCRDDSTGGTPDYIALMDAQVIWSHPQGPTLWIEGMAGTGGGARTLMSYRREIVGWCAETGIERIEGVIHGRWHQYHIPTRRWEHRHLDARAALGASE